MDGDGVGYFSIDLKGKYVTEKRDLVSVFLIIELYEVELMCKWNSEEYIYSGVLRTTAVLDHEVDTSYWLAVKAEDDASVPLSSIVHVLVKVLDKNDHAPLPRSPIYFVSVPENSPDTVVAKVLWFCGCILFTCLFSVYFCIFKKFFCRLRQKTRTTLLNKRTMVLSTQLLVVILKVFSLLTHTQVEF